MTQAEWPSRAGGMLPQASIIDHFNVSGKIDVHYASILMYAIIECTLGC